MSRPTGVKVLAGLQFFYSGFGLLSSIAILLIKPFRDSLVESSLQILANNPQFQDISLPVELFQISLMLGAGFGILFSLFGLLLGFSLLKLQKWAWICTLILQIIQILGSLQGIVAIFSMNSVTGLSLSQQIFQFAISGVIIYYLLKRDIRQAFGWSTTQEE
ncbi:MAG: hypothetical protein AAFW75_13860 [Cyanobacteria bacterium J06636_16]